MTGTAPGAPAAELGCPLSSWELPAVDALLANPAVFARGAIPAIAERTVAPTGV